MYVDGLVQSIEWTILMLCKAFALEIDVLEDSFCLFLLGEVEVIVGLTLIFARVEEMS